jgi:hypothetical protein
LTAILLFPVLGYTQAEQPNDEVVRPIFTFRPVINEGLRDGVLLGGEFGLGVQALREIFQINVGLAFGLKSLLPRLRTSVDYAKTVSFSYGDWPESLVLGREGEQGVHLAADLIRFYNVLDTVDRGFFSRVVEKSRFRGTGFIGNLWPNLGEEAGPEVRYGHLNAVIHWPLSRNYSIQTIGEYLFGQLINDLERNFQTFSSASKLTLNQLLLEVRVGEVQNPVELPEFELNLGLRSYPANVSADRFVVAHIERKFDILSAYVFRLDLTNLLGPQLGWIPLRLKLESTVFFEGAALLNRENEIEEILFGWGTSLVFPDLQLRIDLAVNREGSPSLKLETGVVPAF